MTKPLLASALAVLVALPLAAGCDSSSEPADEAGVAGTWEGRDSDDPDAFRYVYEITVEGISIYGRLPPATCWTATGLPFLRQEADGRYLYSGASNLQLYVTRDGPDRIGWEWVTGGSGTATRSSVQTSSLSLCGG